MSLKLIWEPKVYLIAGTATCPEPMSDFLDANGAEGWTTDTVNDEEFLVEFAGRVCYMSFKNPRPGGNKAYLQHILESGHGSVLEHAVFTLLIEGVSRSLTHELVRHRAGFAYSQLSQRYVDEGDVGFVVPPALEDAVRDAELSWDNDPSTASEEAEGYPGTERGVGWLESVSTAREEYVALCDYLSLFRYAHIEDKTARRKAAREAARSVLPNATETKIVVTGNARAWRHFIEIRASKFADAEIRRLARKVHAILEEAAPNIFGDYQDTPDGLATPYRKV